MECVLEKMGLAHGEFTNPSGTGRVQLYRGGDPAMGTPPGAGARIDDSTPHADALYGDAAAILGYDLVVSDCEGQTWDAEFDGARRFGRERPRVREPRRPHVRESPVVQLAPRKRRYAVRHGRSHRDGPRAGGHLGDAVRISSRTGNGLISIGRPNASPRIQNFADWMVNEGVTTAPDTTSRSSNRAA